MRLIAVAIFTGALCLCAALADASPTITTRARTEWNLWALAGLILFFVLLLRGES